MVPVVALVVASAPSSVGVPVPAVGRAPIRSVAVSVRGVPVALTVSVVPAVVVSAVGGSASAVVGGAVVAVVSGLSVGVRSVVVGADVSGSVAVVRSVRKLISLLSGW